MTLIPPSILPASIHGRMLLISALATLVALAVAGMAILGVLQGFVTRGLDQRLDAELSLLATAVRANGTIDNSRLEQVRAALAMEPGWRWRIAAPTGTASSADFPQVEAGPPPPLPPGPPGERRPPPPITEPLEGPRAQAPQPGEGHDADGRRVHLRSVMLPSTAGTVTLTAAAPWAMVQKPVRGALLPLLAILAILGAVLGGAALVQLRLGLRPLRRLRADVAAVRDGRAHTVAEDQPEELRPLATELNALLQDNSRTLATARASAANLAHALKTPVAALALELRDDPPRAALVDRLYGTIRHHLARARNAVTERRAATSLAETIADLLGTVAQLHADRALVFDDTAQANVTVAIERSDLEELLGNLLDNAARHAASRVAIATTAQDGTVRITVSDDGPGIPVADRLRATAPGVRLDERGDGDGFGLAIVRDLAELNGGRLLLDEAPGGGLAATVELPRAGGAS